ncbi:MAG: DUF1127 domain-containing protein [Pseudomonadota bacterium]|nr:DUF1127 domain-containing protein [Pseudomonadota bacterium]
MSRNVGSVGLGQSPVEIRPVSTIAALGQRALRVFQTWQRRLEQRQQLASLDERLLKDMGISPMDASAEVAKPFWKD